MYPYIFLTGDYHMSIVIQLVNGSPKKKQGEKMAGVILTRDPKLGFRMKVQAVPSGREIHRLVSDCPLAITEQTLLWLQRHKWQWRLHPNSLDVRELLRQVKTYTDLLPAEHIGDACDLLLENFRPNNPDAKVAKVAEQQDPTKEEMMQQMLMMQQQMASMQSQNQPQGPTSGMESKMQRTRQRAAQAIQQVEQTVAANQRREQMQQEVLENLDSIVEEVDSIVSEEMETPKMFPSPQAAIDWAMELGVFDSEEEAKSEYQSLKTQESPKNAEEMASIWTSTCVEIYNIINDDDSSESEE